MATPDNRNVVAAALAAAATLRAARQMRAVAGRVSERLRFRLRPA
jgi:hypothetical protein